MVEKIYSVRPMMGKWVVFEHIGIDRARPVFEGSREDCYKKADELKATNLR